MLPAKPPRPQLIHAAVVNDGRGGRPEVVEHRLRRPGALPNQLAVIRVTEDAHVAAERDVHPLVVGRNGETRQRGHTSEMMIRIPQLIAAASSIMTLEPGDVIATGTPAGAGMGTGRGFLQAGDEVVCEIAGIGALRNQVGMAEPLESV